MSFVSTRDLGRKEFSLEDVVSSGYADDGGMYLPSKVPKLPIETLRRWSDYSYKDVMYEVLSLFTSRLEIPATDLRELVMSSFDTFGHEDVVTLKEMSTETAGEGRHVHVCELWHGPTSAFKDLSLRVVAKLIDYFVSRRKSHVYILVGTSGDTGSSAINACKDLENVDIVVLYPGGGLISEIQEFQMNQVDSPNVHVFAIEGNSDDTDEPIREVFEDQEFSQKYPLCSLNSINVGRILVQIAHHIYCYLRIAPDCETEVSFSVPTGACGNITACMISRMMGVPIRHMCAAVNENDIVHRLIETGNFVAAPQVKPTFSNAMDIGVPYNVERILFLLTDGDASMVSEWMREWRDTSAIRLSPEWHAKLRDERGFRSMQVDQKESLEQLASVFKTERYLVDPHTAVGVHAAVDANSPLANETHVAVISTAHPVKFPAAIQSALSITEQEANTLALAQPPGHPVVDGLLRAFSKATTKRHPCVFKKSEMASWGDQLRDIVRTACEARRLR